MKKNQTSESFLIGAILSFSGGLQDAYTYNCRNQVFANAQTGNIVLMSQHLMMRNWKIGIYYFLPTIAFALGILVAERIGYRYKEKSNIHWRQIILGIEIIILSAVGFISNRHNMVANMMVSFSCAMQVQTFRTVHGYGYASTMCIGNLRSGMESLSIYLRKKEQKQLIKSLHYFGIIIIFALGAGMGGILTIQLGLRTIWICSTLLVTAFLIMFNN